MYRNTYAKVNLSHIKNNVSKIIRKYSEYEYYFGVVKANAYGHGLEAMKAMIDGGCNYLAVALLEEALEIRNQFSEIPILCLGVITNDEVELCIKHHITVTINSLEIAQNLCHSNCANLKVHVKLNTGMNRLGISSIEELQKTIQLLKQHSIVIEGIYTHIYEASSQENTEKQFLKFQDFITSIDYQEIPIIHISASEALTQYSKMESVNGCRLGIIMYGFTQDLSLHLESTFSLHSKIIQINFLNPGDTLGYNGIYKACKRTKIAVVPIGYADGIIRQNTGRTVFVHNQLYPIVGNICMDMLFIEVDETVNVNDEVILLKDISHIEETANYLKTIPYEILCSISSRVPRIYDESKK